MRFVPHHLHCREDLMIGLFSLSEKHKKKKVMIQASITSLFVTAAPLEESTFLSFWFMAFLEKTCVSITRKRERLRERTIDKKVAARLSRISIRRRRRRLSITIFSFHLNKHLVMYIVPWWIFVRLQYLEKSSWCHHE